MRGMPSLMAARWVGQNAGGIFRRLRIKVHWINLACAGMSVVCNAVFRLTTSCCIPEIFAINSRNLCDIAPKFSCFLGHQISGGGSSTFLTKFYKSGSPTNMWQCLVMIGQATSEITQRKKGEDLTAVKQIGRRPGQHSWPYAGRRPFCFTAVV